MPCPARVCAVLDGVCRPWWCAAICAHLQCPILQEAASAPKRARVSFADVGDSDEEGGGGKGKEGGPKKTRLERIAEAQVCARTHACV